jgi:hypothetical protein
MKRDRNETVTHPLLIPCTPGEAQGIVRVLQVATAAVSEDDAEGIPLNVRVFGTEDMRRVQRRLKGPDALRFRALLALRGGIRENDRLQLEGAADLFETLYRRHLERPLTEFEKQMLRLSQPDVSPERWKRVGEVVNLRWSREAILEHPARVLGVELSLAIGTNLPVFSAAPRPMNEAPALVLWESGGDLIPAILCTNEIVALYVRCFYQARLGELGFQRCAHCGKIFLQRQTTQFYCSIAHREAHRQRRYRQNLKEKRKESNGPEKTR